MGFRSRALFWIALLFVFYTAGCIGPRDRVVSRSQLGTIRGQVVDDVHGDGIAGVVVRVQGTSVGALTDDRGVYELDGVPRGKQVVVVEYPNRPDTSSPMAPLFFDDPITLSTDEHGGPRLSRGGDVLSVEDAVEQLGEAALMTMKVSVDVHPHIVNVVPPLSLPVFGTFDNVFLYNLEPPIRRVLSAGRRVTLDFDIHYALHSADEGAVVILFSWEDEGGIRRVQEQIPMYVTRGSRNAVTTFVLDVPNRSRLSLHIALGHIDGQNIVIQKLKSYGDYVVESGDEPMVPDITLVGYEDHRLRFLVEGGHPVRLDVYEFRMKPYSEPFPHVTVCDGQGDLLATFGDPDLQVIDVFPLQEGRAMTYWLCMKTTDGRKLVSNLVHHTVPSYGLKDVYWPTAVADMIADPRKDVLYVADDQTNEIVALNMADDRVLKRIGVGAKPKAMAMSDDGRLFVGHESGAQVAVIDVDLWRIVDWIPGLHEVKGIAVDSENHRLYVSHHPISRPGTMPSIRAIDLTDLTKLWDMDIPGTGPLTRMKVLSEHTLYASGHIIDTKDRSVIAKLDLLPLRPMPFMVDGQLIRGHRRYDGESYGLIDDFEAFIIAYDDDRGRMYGFSGQQWGSSVGMYEFDTVYEYEKNDDTGMWEQRARVFTGRDPRTYQSYVLSSDGNYLYLPFGTTWIKKIDWSARRKGKPS